MAAIAIKIIYNGPLADTDRVGSSIFRMFEPTGSYIDSDVYTNGYANEDGVGDGEAYGKSIYATNVEGWGELFGLLPMASSSVKIAQFERAIYVAFEAQESGAENEGVEFEVEGYEEELFWNQMAPHFVGQGFYIKVGDKEYGEAPEASESTDSGSEGDSESAGGETGGETGDETGGDDSGN